MVLGIDGCRAGWVAIALHEDGAFADAAVAGSLDEIFVRFPRFRTAGIDMPLILLGAPRLPADIAARKLLGPVRGRSVFPAPPTFVIEDEWLAASVADVNRESRKRYGNGVPAQRKSPSEA
jgi:predicted RNase H-like nuclease